MPQAVTKSRKGIIVVLLASVSLVACSTQEGTGTGIGAILGAAVGGLRSTTVEETVEYRPDEGNLLDAAQGGDGRERQKAHQE